MFETTLAGSLPKPSWLATPNVLWAPWTLTGAPLLEAKDDATALAIRRQEEAGIDIVSDGEQARQHFVHGFLAEVDGVDFDKKVRMGIRNNRYDADCPTVTSALKRRKFVHEREARVARAATSAQAQVHPARADDPDRHPGRRLLRRPGEDGLRLRRAAEPGSPRSREGWASTSSSSTSPPSTSISTRPSNGACRRWRRRPRG